MAGFCGAGICGAGICETGFCGPDLCEAGICEAGICEAGFWEAMTFEAGIGAVCFEGLKGFGLVLAMGSLFSNHPVQAQRRCCDPVLGGGQVPAGRPGGLGGRAGPLRRWT